MNIEFCEVCTLVESTLANTLYTLANIDSLEMTIIIPVAIKATKCLIADCGYAIANHNTLEVRLAKSLVKVA